MRKFTSWEEAKKAYGWIGSEPIAQQAKQLFEREHTVALVVPELYVEQLAVIEAAKAQNRIHDDWADDNSNRKVEMAYRSACLRTCRRVRELLAADGDNA
jgi:hypothetical protein